MKKTIAYTTKALTLLVTFNGAILFSNAQDAHITQAYSNPLKLNPAIMGANSDLKVMLNYRNQWSAIDKGFTTYSFTTLYPIFVNEGKGKLDIGFNAMNDKAGAFQTTDFSLAVDYNKQIAENNSLCLSLMGGYVQKSLAVNTLFFDQQYVSGSYNPTNASNEIMLNNKVSHPDVGFGLMWYFNPKRDNSKINAYAGVSGFHMNKPNQSFVAANGTLPQTFSYQAGIKILGENKIDISPNIRVISQNGNQVIATGLYVDYNFSEKAKFVVGSWYRRNDAMAFLLGFEHKSFTFGYSYDVVVSDLSKVVSGVNANEVTLSYKFNKAEKKGIAMNTSPFSSF